MDNFKRILEIIDANIILCLIPAILSLGLIESFFKNKFQTKIALHLIRWIVIIYTILNLIYFIIGMILKPQVFAIIERTTGPYWWSYWLMTLGALLLPFTLFYKKIGLKKWYLIFVLVFFKIGKYFELFVILITSLHRDYLPNDTLNLFFSNITIIFFQGLLIVILLLGLINVYDKFFSRYVTSQLRSK